MSSITYSDRSFSQLTTSFGGEVAVELGVLRPALRGGYSIENQSGDNSAAVRLTSAQHTMGSTVISLDGTERDSAFGELRIAMRDGALSGYFSASGRWGRGEDDARVAIGVSFAL